MSKSCLIVSSFSVCLIALFATLVYLISNINPPTISESKYDDADYIFSPNEVLSNQKIRYGLEKATGEYDDDQPSKNIRRFKKVHKNTDIPDLLPSNVIQENYTKIVTKPIRATKDMRRSINEEKQQEHNKEEQRSLLLEIKGLAEQPGIKIKLVAEKLKSKASRKYRNSAPKIKTKSKINYIELDNDNNIREASVVIAENGTFILNIFNNSIDLIEENDTVFFESENNNRKNASDNYNSQEINTLNSHINAEKHKTFVVDSSLATKMESSKETVDAIMYTFNLMNLSAISATKITTESLPTSTLTSEKDKPNFTIDNNKKPWEGTTEQSNLPDKNLTNTKVIDEDIFITELNKGTHTTGFKRTGIDVYNDLSTSLVDLLIPEATATLPSGN